eukprot:2418276-Rhodomonas_salina.1
MEQKTEQTPQERLGGRKSRKIARKLKRAAKRAVQEAEKINENVDEWFSLISGGRSAFVTTVTLTHLLTLWQPHNYDARVNLDLAKLSPHRDGAYLYDRPATARTSSTVTASKPPRMPMSARESAMSVRSTANASTHGRQVSRVCLLSSLSDDVVVRSWLTHELQAPSIMSSVRQQRTGAQSVASFSNRVEEDTKANEKAKVSEQGADSIKFWAESVKHVNVPGLCKVRQKTIRVGRSRLQKVECV